MVLISLADLIINSVNKHFLLKSLAFSDLMFLSPAHKLSVQNEGMHPLSVGTEVSVLLLLNQ